MHSLSQKLHASVICTTVNGYFYRYCQALICIQALASYSSITEGDVMYCTPKLSRFYPLFHKSSYTEPVKWPALRLDCPYLGKL